MTRVPLADGSLCLKSGCRVIRTTKAARPSKSTADSARAFLTYRITWSGWPEATKRPSSRIATAYARPLSEITSEHVPERAGRRSENEQACQKIAHGDLGRRGRSARL